MEAETKMSMSCGVRKTTKGAGEGSRHWYLQRISGVGLIWLSLWLVKFLLSLIGESREEMMETFQTPYNTTSMILFLGFGFYHGWLGLNEVIEDYVHAPCVKETLKTAILFAMIFLSLIGVLSVLKLFMS